MILQRCGNQVPYRVCDGEALKQANTLCAVVFGWFDNDGTFVITDTRPEVAVYNAYPAGRDEVIYHF
jgi:hypothetical protein